jgi:hypothetical protein
VGNDRQGEQRADGSGLHSVRTAGGYLELHVGSYWLGTTLALTRNGATLAPITVQTYGGSGAAPVIAGAHPCVSITGRNNVVRGIWTINCYGPNWGPEQTIQCLDDLDNDFDGKVNDGCPAIGPAELVCFDALDNDADGGFVNDGCPLSGYQPTGVRINGDNNTLENGSSQGNMIGVYIRQGSDINRVTGYSIRNNQLGGGMPSSGLGLNVHGSKNEIDHNVIQNNYWINPHDPLGNETGDQCTIGNAADDDADTLVNDGCPVIGSSAESACADLLDNDGDGLANDGCAAVGGGTCRRGNAIEIYAEGSSSASNNYVHHNLAVDNKTFSELGKDAAGGGLADGNAYTFNVVRGSLPATICSDATGCPLGAGLKGQSGLVTRGAADLENGPVTNTAFNNNTVYLTGDCSQGISCGSGCGDDIITVKNTIAVASWNGAYSSGSFLPVGVDYDSFREIGSGSGFHCQLSAVGNCPGLPHGMAHGTDPGFLDAANWDLHLRCSAPISLAVDSGTALGYVSDYDGVSMPQDGNHDATFATDIGAYEMSCPPPSPTATPAPDSDRDGVRDAADNCPNIANPAQTNTDAMLAAAGARMGSGSPPPPLPADGLGNACDSEDDSDGWSDSAESVIGTNPLDNCAGAPGGGDAWPGDINSDTFVDISDIALVGGNFGTAVPLAPARHNVAPDPPDGFVDITDIVRVGSLFGKSCA